jgi:hypothetical protein
MSSAKTLTSILIGCVCVAALSLPAYGSVNLTTTAVVAAPSTVVGGTAVTLTATVTGTNDAVTIGLVLFCNATAAHCDGAAVLGAGQVGANHTASVKLVLGVGTHQIDAVYAGALFPGGASSTSPAITVTVTPDANYPTSTTIAASGSVGDYTLTGTVTAFGRATATGTVSFLDTSNGDTAVGSAALNPATLATVFDPSGSSPISLSQVEFVVSGDFNNDGIPDLAVLSNGSPGSVDVFLGNGDGTFQMPAASSSTVGYGPRAMAGADVNGDGLLDLVVVNECADGGCANGSVSVLLGNGNGTFQPAVAFATGQNSKFVAVGDLNFDGLPDLAVTNNGDGTVSVLLSNGLGSLYSAATSYVVGSGAGSLPTGVAMGIFNPGLGFWDLAVSTSGDHTVTILPENGYGTFNVGGETTLDLPAGAAPYWLATGDLRDDGTLDLVVPDANSSSVYVLLGNGNATFQPYATYSVGLLPQGVSLGDINGDGVLDLVVPNTDSDGTVSVLRGNGDGTFASQMVYTVGNNPAWAALADFNGDGMLDIATSDLGSSTATILLQAQTETATATGINVLGAGSHLVLASYPGDAERAASESGTTPLTGTPLTSTTTALVAAPNPAIAGQTVTLTATITPTPNCSAPGTADPREGKTFSSRSRRDSPPVGAQASPGPECSFGSVSFYDGATLLGSGTVNSSGVATFTSTSLPVGSDGLTAVYSGNVSFAGSTSSAYTEVISLTSTTTTLSGSPNPATTGASVTLTATISPAPGASAGTVNFYDGETLLGTVSVNSSGVATLAITSLPAGSDSLTAVYSGNADFGTSTSIVFSETVNPLTSTTTTLAAAPNPAIAGQSVMLTATVVPAPTGSPAGTVSFYHGTTLLGATVVNSSGVAVFTTSSLPTGALIMTAVYSGNAGFAGSTSSALTETVATATATTLLAAPNPAIAGQSVTLTATVVPAPTGSPAGTVSFYHATTLLGATAVNSSGVAVFTTSSLPTGALIMTAMYSGNAAFGGSTSSALTVTVAAATAVTTSTALTVSPDPAFDNQPTTLTATVSPAPTGSPAGTVSFYSGTTLLGTGTLNASGVATFTSSSLVVGSDSITAVYAGNSGFAASTSSAVSLTVATSFTVTAPTTAVPVAPGGAATVNLTVPPLGGAFNSVVTLSASGLPAGATATFNPATVTPGSAGAPTVMTIQLATLAAGIPASEVPANHPRLPAGPLALGFGMFGMFGTVFGAVHGRKRLSRQFALVLLLASLGVTASVLASCGGGFANTPQTSAGNYTITVTGTSGSFHASTTVTLAVK